MKVENQFVFVSTNTYFSELPLNLDLPYTVKGCTHRAMILCDRAVDSHQKQ